MRNVTYINAGAGSGKTYTLTRILAEKLSERDDNDNPVIMPSQVILTTFTDLAAARIQLASAIGTIVGCLSHR